MSLPNYDSERRRLMEALGNIVEGGLVEDIQPVGTANLPLSSTNGHLDIGLEVWPFPLSPESQKAVEALGYELAPKIEGEPPQRFRHTQQPIQLFFIESGHDWWQNALVLRDYLQNNPAVCQDYVARKPRAAAPTVERDRFFKDWLGKASQWWINQYGFKPLETMIKQLEGFDRPWHISSGWALDLWLGRVSRVHHDVDIEIARPDALALQAHLAAKGWKFVTPFEEQLQPWALNQPLVLPRHQAHAHRGSEFIDFLISDFDSNVWHYRRNPIIIRTLERASLHTDAGLPYLAPELVLLFKSRSAKDRPKDFADFDTAHSQLEPERRAWLRWALTATDPTHPWLERLPL